MKKLLFSLLLTPLVFCTPALASFSDVSNDNQFLEAINYAQQNNIVKGYTDGTFKPEKTINRAEFTKIIIEATVAQNEITGKNCFGDVKNEWFAKYVCTAKNKGIINGFSDGKFKPEQNISFVEAAKIISLAFGDNITPDSKEWFKPYVLNLETKKAIPSTIQDFSYSITRGDMVEMIWRVKEKKTNKESLVYNFLKKFDYFSIEMDSWSDSEKFYSFLENHTDEIVKLNIRICDSSLIDYGISKFSKNCPIFEKRDSLDELGTSLSVFDITEIGGEVCPGDLDYIHYGGVSYYWGETGWGWDKFAECDSGDFAQHVMSGYFLVPESSGYGQGWSEWVLTPIDKKEIILKNY